MNTSERKWTRNLKKKWSSMPDECFRTTSFGELAVGQMFICLPCPGDNHGHGGLRNKHFIFKKTRHSVVHPQNSKARYGISHGRALRVFDGQISDFPQSMDVVHIG
jgi:hypothetical protein